MNITIEIRIPDNVGSVVVEPLQLSAESLQTQRTVEALQALLGHGLPLIARAY